MHHCAVLPKARPVTRRAYTARRRTYRGGVRGKVRVRVGVRVRVKVEARGGVRVRVRVSPPDHLLP